MEEPEKISGMMSFFNENSTIVISSISGLILVVIVCIILCIMKVIKKKNTDVPLAEVPAAEVPTADVVVPIAEEELEDGEDEEEMEMIDG